MLHNGDVMLPNDDVMLHNVTLFGFDNHDLLFFSAFGRATIRDERLS